MRSYSKFLVLFASFTSLIFCSSRAQSIFNLFEENNTVKILEWFKENPNGQIDILNIGLNDFYNKRLPTEKLNCLPERMDILELAILNGNSIVYNELLTKPKYYQNTNLLSQALNFALAKNNAELFKKLESMGAQYNVISPYFFNQNSLQIAFAYAPGSDLTKLILEKSKMEDFAHVDCLGRNALYYLASNKNADLSKFPLDKMRNNLLSGNESVEFPIEQQLKFGNLNNVKLLWNLMKDDADFSEYASESNFRRLKYHALLSKNNLANDWIDSLTAKTFKQDKNKLHHFYRNEKSYDLNKFVDESMTYSEFFFDLKILSKNATDNNFLNFLKSWQTTIYKELGLNPQIQPTYHGRTGLLSFEELKYVSYFFTNQFWEKNLKPDALEKLITKQEPFFYMIDVPYPKKYEMNFNIDYDILNGHIGESLERIKFVLSELPVLNLTVKNVTDFNIEYTSFFPNLDFLEIQWTDTEMPEYYVNPDLMNCKSIKFVGMREIQFPQNLGMFKLEKIIVPLDAEIINKPKSIKVIYE